MVGLDILAQHGSKSIRENLDSWAISNPKPCDVVCNRLAPLWVQLASVAGHELVRLRNADLRHVKRHAALSVVVPEERRVENTGAVVAHEGLEVVLLEAGRELGGGKSADAQVDAEIGPDLLEEGGNLPLDLVRASRVLSGLGVDELQDAAAMGDPVSSQPFIASRCPGPLAATRDLRGTRSPVSLL